MSAVNFDNITPERQQAARRAKRLLGGPGYEATDIDHDIRGSLLAGHAEELDPGLYFNPGSDPDNPEWFDVHGKKTSANADQMERYRSGATYQNAKAKQAASDPEGQAGGTGIGSAGTGLAGQVEELLSGNLKGQGSRYDDATVGRLKGQAFETGQSRLKQQLGAVDAEAAREGIGGAAVSALRSRARSDTAKDYSGATRDIANQKVQADYEDRKAALSDAMDYVNKTRDYQLGQAKNQNDRDRIESEAAVARERIASESSIVDRQLSAQAELAAQSARSGAAGQNSSQKFQMTMANLRHDWEVENRDYLMPFQLSQLALGAR